MQSSQGKQLAFWSIGFIILIVAIGLYAARNRIGTMITLSTDHIPPMATFSFVTEDGRMSYGMLKVNPGETFTPQVTITDKVDSTPKCKVWITDSIGNANEGSGRPVELGKPLALELGLYFIHASVTDAAGNNMIYSTIISVYNNKPGLIASSGPGQTQSATQADLSNPNGQSIIDSNGTPVKSAIKIAKVGEIVAVIEEAEIVKGLSGVHSIKATILISAKRDLSDLNLAHLVMIPVGNAISWEITKDKEADYLSESNIWRVSFEQIYNEPLNALSPLAFQISIALGKGDDLSFFVCKTNGIADEPQPFELIAAKVANLKPVTK